MLFFHCWYFKHCHGFVALFFLPCCYSKHCHGFTTLTYKHTTDTKHSPRLTQFINSPPPPPNHTSPTDKSTLYAITTVVCVSSRRWRWGRWERCWGGRGSQAEGPGRGLSRKTWCTSSSRLPCLQQNRKRSSYPESCNEVESGHLTQSHATKKNWVILPKVMQWNRIGSSYPKSGNKTELGHLTQVMQWNRIGSSYPKSCNEIKKGNLTQSHAMKQKRVNLPKAMQWNRKG